MAPQARVAILKGSARQVFAERGYSSSGLAEIAERAAVSKTLLYHYFPKGRPEIMAAVMDGLLADLTAATAEAVGVPAGAEDRIRAWVEAFLAFFVDQPDAFRLLFREPWGSGDPLVTIRSFRAMVELSRQLAEPLGLHGAAPSAQGVAAADFVIGGLSRLRPPAPGGPGDRSRRPPHS